MTETTVGRKKVRRSRKRVYETGEPAKVQEMSREAADVPIGEPAQLPPEVRAAAVEEPAAGDPGDVREARALTVVRNYTLLSAGVGIVPFPLVDMAAMLALQMLLVRGLAKLYGIPYAEQRVKAAVAGLIGGFDAGYIGYGALKLVPFFGIFSYAAMPAINAAISYAVGRVFIQHFESGGTFLDFDAKKVRAYFDEKFREGRAKALSGAR
jgi:uncharacterized protein (DUF697 family)